MTPSSITVIQSSFPSLREVALGSFVPDPRNPGLDNWPEVPFAFSADQIYIRADDALTRVLNEEKHTKLLGNITQLFSGLGEHQTTSTIRVLASTATEYVLRNPLMHFKQMCKDGLTREWIEETWRDHPIFMIVGFTTVTDAKSESLRFALKKIGVAGELPVTAIVTSGVGAAIPGTNILDVGVDVSNGYHTSVSSSSIARGERVLGIQYRKVSVRSFFGGNVDKAKLQDTQWMMFTGGSRGECDIIVEADLQDSADLDELDLEEGKYGVIDESGKCILIVE